MTPNVYQYIKDRDHRLCFLAAYVDCQPWTQSGPKRKVGLGQAIEGIRKLDSESSQPLKTNTQMSAGLSPVTGHPLTLTQNTTPMTEPNTNSPNPGSQAGEGKKRRKHRGGKNKKRGPPPTATQDSSSSTHNSNNNFNNTNSNNNVVINVTP